MSRPPKPPYGILIEKAREQAGLSMREAARRAGISDAWWRYVVNGWQNGPVTGPADTVAVMASVVGLPPERLATDGQRPDAAKALQKLLDTQHAPEPAQGDAPQIPAPADGDAGIDRAIRLLVEGLDPAKPELQAVLRAMYAPGARQDAYRDREALIRALIEAQDPEWPNLPEALRRVMRLEDGNGQPDALPHRAELLLVLLERHLEREVSLHAVPGNGATALRALA